MRPKLQSLAYWAIPSLFCLIVYWPGLIAWFQQDDFVWLNLPNQAHNLSELLGTLFRPTPQGSWRVLSERLFFLVFGNLFAANALPYRIFVFATMFANLALVASMVTRAARSRAAGFWAAILWTANSKLATVMAWTSAYNIVCCGFFLLLAFRLFLEYTETGDRRFYRWTWTVFLIGFLAMETNVIFPLLAATYAVFCARKYFRATLPFLVASGVYTILHFIFAPNHTEVYKIYIDGAIPHTLWTYWRRTFEPVNLRFFTPFSTVAGTVQMAACSLALLGFAIYEATRKQWLPLVFLAWYFIALGPVVPLREHISDYYLTLPAMCLAMVAGLAIVTAWRSGTAWKALSAMLAAAFLMQSVPVARHTAQWFEERSKKQEALVMGVARAHELHPGKTILLSGINDEMFWGAITQRPFVFLGINDVYLTPDSPTWLTPHPELDDLSHYIYPPAKTRQGLDRDEVVVYRYGAGPLQNVTSRYAPPAVAAPPPVTTRINVADPSASDHLGPTWYPLDSGGMRWMPRAATVHMAGPRSDNQRLYVTALCPAAQIEKGPLEMTVIVDGVRAVPVRFTKPNDLTTFAFPLPPSATGKTDIQIGVELDRTVRVGADLRDLGLAFGTFEIK